MNIGDKFGRLAVESEIIWRETRGGRPMKYRSVRCECGNVRVVQEQHLNSGHTQSCGCYQSECSAKAHWKHGGAYERLYSTWRNMVARCHNPKKSGYHQYGSKGIRVCQEWHRYEPFRDWALGHGYKDGLQIDRIDGTKGYSPDNCRWVTVKENMRNTIKNKWVTIYGETKTVAAWCEDKRCKVPSAFRGRIQKGWNPEHALRLSYRKGKAYSSLMPEATSTS